MRPEKRYPLAPNPVFWSLQGEGHLRGFGMVFLRLAGCSVGCPGCDTDYTVASRSAPSEIAGAVQAMFPAGVKDRWVWITGGEPADHDLMPLIVELRRYRVSIAVATSGHKRVIPPVDWLSVSPHDISKVVQVYGNELKLVDGLGGLNLWEAADADPFRGFMYRYVQPLWDAEKEREDPESLARCLAFLGDYPDWALSRQDHKHWGLS